MNKNINEHYYKTSDLAEAAVLSLNFPIKSIDKQDPRRAVFAFDKTSSLDDLVSSFWRKEYVVEPQVFMGQLRILKSRIYSLN